MADQEAGESIAQGQEGLDEVTTASEGVKRTDSGVSAEIGPAESVEAPAPEVSTDSEEIIGAKSDENNDRAKDVEGQSSGKLSRGDSESVGSDKVEGISSSEGTAGYEGDDENGIPLDSKPSGSEEKGEEGVEKSVASDNVKLASPVRPETQATLTTTVIKRTRYGSDPRGMGGVGKVTYKSVKVAQKEEAVRIDEEEKTADADTTPDVSSLPGYLPWENDLEMISAYQEKKEGLMDSYQQYLKENPELWALLADFLQALLIQKPENVFQFAHDFFRLFDPQAPPPPSLPTTLPPDTGFLFAPGFPLNS